MEIVFRLGAPRRRVLESVETGSEIFDEVQNGRGVDLCSEDCELESLECLDTF
jgi:hypothetical protein